MKEKKDDARKPLTVPEIVAKALGIVMVVLYIIFGTTIIFQKQLTPHLTDTYRLTFGILLILYGLFRGYKYYKKHSQGL